LHQQRTIAVVVPAYNEEKLLAQTIATLPDWVDRVVVVDDASGDGTAEVAAACAAGDPRVTVIEHRENQGVGGAIASGYRWCLDEGIDVAVVMAGDGQMDPADLPALLAPILAGEANYVKGNRLFTGDAWKIIPRVRYLGNSMLSLLTKIASGYWHVADSQCGYTAIDRRALATVDWGRTYRRFGQPNDLLVRLNVENLRVVDVPVRPIYGIGERSGVKPIRMIPRLSWLLLRLFLFRLVHKYVIRDFHPLVFFYLLGLLLLLPGLGLGVYLLVFRLLVGPVATTSALFASFLVVSGLQSVLWAMWFDMEYNRSAK